MTSRFGIHRASGSRRQAHTDQAGPPVKTVYSDDHNLHAGLLDPRGGTSWRESSECPARANNVDTEIRDQSFGDIIPPQPFDESKYLRLHAPDYLEFLKTAWDEWVAAGLRPVSRDGAME